MKKFVLFCAVFTLINNYNICAEICANSCLASTCNNPCDISWVTGSFLTNGKQPSIINGSNFQVRRIDAGLYAINFKKPFCCTISVVATSNFVQTVAKPNCMPISQQNFDINPGAILPISIATSTDGACIATANTGGNVSVFQVDPISCNLMLKTGPGFPLAVGSTPSDIAYSSRGCLAVANSGDNTISMFSNSSSCMPVKIGTFANAGGTNPGNEFFLAFSPSGKCLATVNNTSDNVSLFQVNSDCTLNAPTTFSTGTPSRPQVLTFISDSCLAVGLTSLKKVFLYKIVNCAAASLITSASLPAGPIGITFSASTNCLTILNANSTISVFKVSDCSQLTEVPGSPFSVPGLGGGFPKPTFSADGSCLFVPNQEFDNIFIFKIDPITCALTTLPGSPFALSDGLGPTAIAYLTNCNGIVTSNLNSNNVTVFELGSTSGISNIKNPQICESISSGCFILQLPPEADNCALVTFFATPCT